MTRASSKFAHMVHNSAPAERRNVFLQRNRVFSRGSPGRFLALLGVETMGRKGVLGTTSDWKVLIDADAGADA